MTTPANCTCFSYQHLNPRGEDEACDACVQAHQAEDLEPLPSLFGLKAGAMTAAEFRAVCDEMKQRQPPALRLVDKTVNAVYSHVPGLFRTTMAANRVFFGLAARAVDVFEPLILTHGSDDACRFLVLAQDILHDTKDACEEASDAWQETRSIEAAREVLEEASRGAAIKVLRAMDILQ